MLAYFKYGGNTREIIRRIGIVKTDMSHFLTRVHKSKSITKETKTKLVHSLVFSAFMYAADMESIKK